MNHLMNYLMNYWKPRLLSRKRAQGAALVELALVLPLFVTVLLFGMYLSELLRAKLRLLEGSRFLAWEMTAHPLSDYGGGEPALAFEAAKREALAETLARYRDLDSAEDVSPRGFGVEYEEVQAHLADAMAPLKDARGAVGLLGDGGAWSAKALGLAGQGTKASLRGFGFNLGGQVHAELSMRLRSTLLPMHYLDEEGGFFREPMRGGRLGDLKLQAGHTLIADGWALPDGADAVIAGGRAGNHRSGKTESGLHRQVRRMRFWGDEGFVDPSGGFIGGLTSQIPLPLPSFSGAFVVSHGYRLGPSHVCPWLQGYPAEASQGLSNLAGMLDAVAPQCFDTAPFRDTEKYASSLYLRMFHARGRFFMGCQQAQAGDPSSPRDRDRSDRDLRKVDCERAP